MNPSAVQNLIDPNDPKSQQFFNGIQNMASQFAQQPPQMPPQMHPQFPNGAGFPNASANQMPMMSPMGVPLMQSQPTNDYNPDVFEYDDELPEGEFGERVILSDDPIPREIGVVKTIGTKKRSQMMDFNGGDFQDWNSDYDDEDDARIAEFLESQKPRPAKRICIYFQSGTCRNGKSCSFAHEYSEDAGT